MRIGRIESPVPETCAMQRNSVFPIANWRIARQIDSIRNSRETQGGGRSSHLSPGRYLRCGIRSLHALLLFDVRR